MRNRKFIYAALALLTLSFTACQQEEDFAPQGDNESEIRIATRSTTYDGNDDDIVFAAGEMVGIHSAVSGIKHLQLPHPKQKVIPLLDQGLKSFHHAGSVIDFEMEAPATVLFRLV